MWVSASLLDRHWEERAGRQDAGPWPRFSDAGLTSQQKASSFLAEPEDMASLGLHVLGVWVGLENELMAGKGGGRKR